eukprot:scaffold73754_cov28-Tisochrysis_lutea.AAC.1
MLDLVNGAHAAGRPRLMKSQFAECGRRRLVARRWSHGSWGEARRQHHYTSSYRSGRYASEKRRGILL